MNRKSLPAAILAATLCQAAATNAFPNMVEQPKNVQDWWPNVVNLNPLRGNETQSDPMGEDFDYAAAFAAVDSAQLRADVEDVMTTSQDWWPADWGNYGPLFVRMAWHSAGTYRVADGRGGADGGQQRFEPLNSWPDNGNLDKARRLLWPIKQKYGRSVSWADLMVLAGDVAMVNMGFTSFGFAGGRTDDWRPELVYWGPEAEMMGQERFSESGELKKPLGASHMGLIYVNPEGPGGNPDPLASAQRIRETFGRMAMNDEETVALIAGGHTFGKAHGAHNPGDCVGAEPAANGVADQGMGWNNKCGKGNAEDTTTSGLEGAWTAAPTQWTMMYLSNLYAYDWELTESPAGAKQWIPVNGQAADTVPDAHVDGLRHAPMMLTTDLALKEDPAYREITTRFLNDPKEFELAFAKAWFKLTHRDLGPKARYVGSEIPAEDLIWQDPLPEADYKAVSERDVEDLKEQILASGLTVPELVRTAWSAAASYRSSDMRGGANGARIRLAPQRNWSANNPQELDRVLEKLEAIQDDFNGGLLKRKQVSLADLIVLGGAAAIEKAAADAGHDVEVPFIPGRVDASAEHTDAASFAPLEPMADGFRNYYAEGVNRSPSAMLVDKADLLDLTVPEMTVLVGGLRALDANTGGAAHGVFTNAPGTLSNDFFVNLLDMSTAWKPAADAEYVFEGRDRDSGEMKWTATEVDLVFGSNSELRAVAEVYAYNDAEAQFVEDFVAAWTKVMTLDRFDLK